MHNLLMFSLGIFFKRNVQIHLTNGRNPAIIKEMSAEAMAEHVRMGFRESDFETNAETEAKRNGVSFGAGL